MKLTVEIEVPEPRAVALDSTKTAIVVIDMENEFCAPGGKKFIGSPAQEAVRAAAALIQRGTATWGPGAVGAVGSRNCSS